MFACHFLARILRLGDRKDTQLLSESDTVVLKLVATSISHRPAAAPGSYVCGHVGGSAKRAVWWRQVANVIRSLSIFMPCHPNLQSKQAVPYSTIVLLSVAHGYDVYS